MMIMPVQIVLQATTVKGQETQIQMVSVLLASSVVASHFSKDHTILVSFQEMEVKGLSFSVI